MNDKLKQEIKKTIEHSIENFFKDKDVKVTHVLDEIFPVERRIRSLMGGLETSMGTTVWEPIARILAKENGFEVLDVKTFLMPETIPSEILELKSTWTELRKNRGNDVVLSDFVIELKNIIKNLDSDLISNTKLVKVTAGKGIDLWLKKDNKEYIYDIKTNQVNQNGGLALDQNLMDWYIYRLFQDNELNVSAQIAFPFNPFKPKKWWDKQGKRVYPLQDKKDAVVEDDFWDFISGEKGTWENLEKIFAELGTENFDKKFHNIFYK